ncbi:23S rRNA (uracil(1939)-C(5))-methyltransferase RlmD [Collinsella sp. zg1085]|uniref:23S rRNA (uracil(1939)-C(5))-methyltransferase RlmD n=1 Tax=Collinsella sp. zg1085 TaxID=2844380 RepID=UPI001C0D6442|nr:23S rRNA (uracil(1939)-C(5))-methyltransferase RlmD [Collinsella sp. zg1085]QWT17703.1 23S rRNA (uracil(1939)-C(5))-methyltransferase RlmD [Collinsella sp. zg1085]
MATRRNKSDTGAPCPIMHSCGGCELLGLPYLKQLNRKQRAIETLFEPLLKEFNWDITVDAIRGMGGQAGQPHSIARPLHFRYKAATPFAPNAHGGYQAGLFARGSHHIIETPDCVVEAPEARSILNSVARIAEKLNIPAYDEDRQRGQLRYAILRLGWQTNEGLLTLVTAHRDIPRFNELIKQIAAHNPRITCIAQNINGRTTNAILGAETHLVWGQPCMHDKLLGCTFEISPGAFYQVNPKQTEVLYRLAIDGMSLDAGDTLLDAYCGSGTIGLCAAHAARELGIDVQLLGVERNPSGIADAARNAQLNQLDNCATFIAEDATDYIQRLAEQKRHIDVLVMDPPRAGSTPEFLSVAAELAPKRIVYISCNPATQVRDLTLLGKAGYQLTRLTPVDMFPHTAHVETVCLLSHKG